MAISSWANRRVLVSGASSGLGREIAIELAKQKASLILLGRDENRLIELQKHALELGAVAAETLVVDLLSDQGAEKISAIIDREDGDLHLLVNAIGRSDRGYLEQLSEVDLIELFRVNVITAQHATRASLGGLKRAKGCIINIGSLASKIAPVGLGGYAVAKHALAALSHQWRRELEGDGVHVMLVCPGPVLRSDSGSRYQELAKGRGLKKSLSQPAGGAKLKGIDPGELAKLILKGALERKLELVVPGKVRFLVAIASIWPSLGEWILRRSMSGRREESA